MASAGMRISPSAVSATTSWLPMRWPVPRITRTPWLCNSVDTEPSNRLSIDWMRARSASKSRWAVTSVSPICSLALMAPSADPVAIIAFEGMQSHRWAAPPRMSRSTTVTSAPSFAACDAAACPPGPPPMITNRRAMA